jgi:anaerobic selenocysteine-containing dehydrogenase/Fe-S-cluster-containing dehydrogenase component
MSDGMKRRDFLKVLGASGAGAATAGCTTGDVQRLIPYVVPAEEIAPGIPTWYASTCRECPAGCGIHVETHAGRVTKVEGNPDHPVSRGNLCARGQASVQGLYHPDRYAGPIVIEPGVRTLNVTWGTAERQLAERIREMQTAGRGAGVVFLTRSYTGSMEQLVDGFVAAIGARRVVYDVWADQPRDLDFSNAGYLVSFGADFLETWGSPVDYAWQFAQMHSYRNGQRGKFVWVGPHRPLTGLNADQWIAPRPGTELLLAQALAGQADVDTVARETEVPRETIAQLVQEFRAGNGVALGPGPSLSGPNASQLRNVINGLNAGRAGAMPAAAGGGREVAQLAEQMRQGQVEILLIDAPNPAYTLPGGMRFAEAIRQVPLSVSFSSFPDDTSQLCTMVLPDHHFLEAWGDYVPRPGVTSLIQPTMRPVFNTKQVGDVLLAVARNLGADVGGGATTFYDYLRANWQGAGGAWQQALQRGGDFVGTGAGTGAFGIVPLAGQVQQPAAQQQQPAAQQQQPAAQQPGVVAQERPIPGVTEQAREQPITGTAGQPIGTVQADVPAQAGAPVPASYQPPVFDAVEGANFHLVVYPSYRFFDGRTANRPWLLELPDPVTKVSWRSWVEMHPRAAEEMGVRQGDRVEVTSNHGTLVAPVYVYPGVRPDTVAIQTGLGHQAFGRFTEGRGVNPNVLLAPALDEATGSLAPYGVRVAVRPTGVRAGATSGILSPGDELFEQGVRVQHDREIAMAVSVAELAQLEATGQARIPGEDDALPALRGAGGFLPVTTSTDPAQFPPPGTHYGEYIEGSTRWAMVVDLDRCIGCSACVTACYAENNIPVVGPTEVAKGRELAWLRIERYWGVSRHPEEAYTDDATNDTRFLPMMCQHCGNAPCEPVCPVYAAYHTPDGLNGQVYNRCVGTRYCANNCPWKVRVFNWWTYDFAEPLNWQLNPDVTVRDKGVMEKCTFCVQRIREVERNAALQDRTVRDGEVVPACVQTCPTEVFVFGNIQDPNSAVAQAARSVRSYRTFEILNTQPAVVYLSKVTLEEPARGGHH